MHILQNTTIETQTQSERHQRRIRELEEQIESDDRAERLEGILQNTQARADELEFQISKLTQVSILRRHEYGRFMLVILIHHCLALHRFIMPLSRNATNWRLRRAFTRVQRQNGNPVTTSSSSHTELCKSNFLPRHPNAIIYLTRRKP